MSFFSLDIYTIRIILIRNRAYIHAFAHTPEEQPQRVRSKFAYRVNHFAHAHVPRPAMCT